MPQVHHLAWRLLGTLSLFSLGRSLDSINLDLEVLEGISLDELGTPNLDKYQLQYDVTVDEECQYTLRLDFKKPASDNVAGFSTDNFEGDCNANVAGTAPDGLPWHAHRRHWMPFPEYVFDTVGFNHMSMNWRPCGLPPKGLRKARYDMNFYMVIPQYRKFWACREFRSPTVCRYNQTSSLGRGHFTLPRLARDPNFLANMPNGFQPDAEFPEAYEHEGLISYRASSVPATPAAWLLPTFHMSTYDGDTVSWRALIPDSFITSNALDGVFSQNQFYVYQSMPRLPAAWNMTYDSNSKDITVLLHGSAGMCGESFEEAKVAGEQQRKRNLRS
jgi:hypothetical protein